MEKLFWVCVGSAVGGGARYLVSDWALRTFGLAFPYGTLAVNLVGSLLMGVLMATALQTTVLSPVVRLALTTGVLGGFTTFSTFSYETMRSIQTGAFGLALGNVLANVVGGLLACTAGWAGAKRLFGIF